jgi:hypothetical protein
VHGLLQGVKSLSVLKQAKEEHAFLLSYNKTKKKDNIAKSEASRGKSCEEHMMI